MRKYLLISSTIASLLSASLFNAAFAKPTSQAEQEVLSNMQIARKVIDQSGYSALYPVSVSEMPPKANAPFTAFLSLPGRQYIVAAACGSNCAGLTLAVAGLKGNAIALKELDRGENFVLMSAPLPNAGNYVIDTSIDSCATAKCPFGIEVWVEGKIPEGTPRSMKQSNQTTVKSPVPGVKPLSLPSTQSPTLPGTKPPSLPTLSTP